ncbi:MAG: NADH:ubiquinone reductase (Na(+)-transporting) subunit D [Planctomycetota bacterium]
MPDNANATCATAPEQGPFGGKGKEVLKAGLWRENPISFQILGICSALAVTGKLANSLVMGGALIFVCTMSSLLMSMLRASTPRRIRLIAEVAIIATFVILFDRFLKAFYWDMSRELGPYVGLIITNCIVMGRMEAFALANRPLLAALDGAANGLGYAVVLAFIGFARELIGTGRVFGETVLPASWYFPNQLLVLAPGAFFAMGLLIAVANAFRPGNGGKKP